MLLVSTLIWFLPYIYQLSHDSGLIAGVDARYGAVDMIRFALVVVGVELVILFAVLSALLSILFKLLDKSNVMLWRFRIHGLSFLFIWLLVLSLSQYTIVKFHPKWCMQIWAICC